MAGSVQLTPGVVFARDFRVVRPLAEGGMGAVYVVDQLSTGKQRALKLMRPELVADAHSRERFVAEARAGSQIDSEHVVEVLAAGVDDATGVPWLAMELLRGHVLEDVIRQRGRLSPAETLEVFRQLCHGLAAAHRGGLVHRDLKPENVFVAEPRRADAQFTVKILDFGIAKVVQENRTAATSTAAVGTPLWMAPEQSERRAMIRPATDVWALGLIGYYALTGACYWRAARDPSAGITALLRETLIEAMEPASVRAAEAGVALPPGFDDWFARCCARDPGQRFADAAAAFAGLQPVLGAGGSPVGASLVHSPPGVDPRPPTPGAQVARTAYGTPGLAGGTVAMGAPHGAPAGSPAGVITGSAPGGFRPVVPAPDGAVPARRASRGPLVAVLVAALLAAGGVIAAVVITADKRAERTGAAQTLAASAPQATSTPAPLPGVPTTAPTASALEPAPAASLPVATTPPVAPATPLDTSAPSAPAAPIAAAPGEQPAELAAARGGPCRAQCGSDEACVARCRAGRSSARDARRASPGGTLYAAPAPRGIAAPPVQRAPIDDVPETPARADLVAAMGRVRPDVQACSQGETGTAIVAITFASSGRVTMASVSGVFAGTPVGACIARAVRAATVPPFSRPTVSLNYPFLLR